MSFNKKTPTEAGVQDLYPSAYSLIVIRCNSINKFNKNLTLNTFHIIFNINNLNFFLTQIT